MSNSVKNKLVLSKNAMNDISERMNKLNADGVKILEEHSGESNFMGCRTGYCQAWD